MINQQEEILAVSVYMLSFNHEMYIRQAIESVIKQKTTFRYEIVLHDDASTDNSQAIIKEYAEKYPELIIPILQKENQYSQGVNIGQEYIYPKCRGRYIAYCECDDFWLDEKKLQKQFDCLEKYEECPICVHKVACINEKGGSVNKYYPSLETVLETGIVARNWVLEKDYPFQTSSYFLRKEIIKPLLAKTTKLPNYFNGDICLLLLSINIGDFYYIDEVMTNYRINVPGSWSKAMDDNKEGQICHLKKRIAGLVYFNQMTNYKFNQGCKKRIVGSLNGINSNDATAARKVIRQYESKLIERYDLVDCKTRIKYFLIHHAVLGYLFYLSKLIRKNTNRMIKGFNF